MEILAHFPYNVKTKSKMNVNHLLSTSNEHAKDGGFTLKLFLETL